MYLRGIAVAAVETQHRVSGRVDGRAFDAIERIELKSFTGRPAVASMIGNRIELLDDSHARHADFARQIQVAAEKVSPADELRIAGVRVGERHDGSPFQSNTQRLPIEARILIHLGSIRVTRTESYGTKESFLGDPEIESRDSLRTSSPSLSAKLSITAFQFPFCNWFGTFGRETSGKSPVRSIENDVGTAYREKHVVARSPLDVESTH